MKELDRNERGVLGFTCYLDTLFVSKSTESSVI